MKKIAALIGAGMITIAGIAFAEGTPSFQVPDVEPTETIVLDVSKTATPTDTHPAVTTWFTATIYAPNGDVVKQGMEAYHTYEGNMVWVTFADGSVYGVDTENVIFSR